MTFPGASPQLVKSLLEHDIIERDRLGTVPPPSDDDDLEAQQKRSYAEHLEENIAKFRAWLEAKDQR